MMNGTYIFLNPDGTQELGLVVIVQAPTGVVYAHQCGGLNTEVREAEGFAVPLGDLRAARPLIDFFGRFRGWPPPSRPGHPNPWREPDLAELRLLLGAIPFWLTDRADADTRRTFLELDSDRLAELTEAWVPVRTIHGKGILVFSNSD